MVAIGPGDGWRNEGCGWGWGRDVGIHSSNSHVRGGRLQQESLEGESDSYHMYRLEEEDRQLLKFEQFLLCLKSNSSKFRELNI